MTTDTAAATATPRRSALDRETALRLAATEYDRVLAQLTSLSAEDWTRPSGCPPWDVRALAAHMVGMTAMAASLREQLRQMRKAKKVGGVFIDALTGLQVDERSDASPAQLLDELRRLAPRATKARRRTPSFVRGRTMPDEQPLGGRPNSGTERWTFGYLVDVILTRDPWMHRSDIAAATGRPMELTADHDGLLVADVAHEWAARHGSPCRLTLSGPAGGEWTFGEGGPHLELDAVEFCRGLAGRGTGEGLLATEVPF
jgi:uncharacterized protein (TIGR03083 family)